MRRPDHSELCTRVSVFYIFFSPQSAQPRAFVPDRLVYNTKVQFVHMEESYFYMEKCFFCISHQ